jgi:hypothetical protein
MLFKVTLEPLIFLLNHVLPNIWQAEEANECAEDAQAA